MTDAQEVEVLRRDVYPAEVLLPNGKILVGVHVYATSHRVLVYSEVAHRRIELTHELKLTVPFSVPGDRNTLRQGASLQVDTPEGTAWVNAGSGCGCGSALKVMAAPISWTGR